ncbi:MAG: fibronectin type III-like domain-contianing protein, partial [Acidimicrobiales bacterium]
VDVTNTGSRAGVDVVQAYVKYPRATDEPPEQLKGFLRVKLAPHATRSVSLSLPMSSLDVFLNGSFRTIAGTYDVSLGQSSANLPITLPAQVPAMIATGLEGQPLVGWPRPNVTMRTSATR